METPRRPTMLQIADTAGVSRMTVSLALRNHPRIPAATRQRIQQIAERLGYRPDPHVSRLMAYLRRNKPAVRHDVIGLLTNVRQPSPWRHNAHYLKFYTGAGRHAEQLGYKLEEFWLKQPGFTSRRLSQVLTARGIEGLLIGQLLSPSGHLSLDFTNIAAAEHGQTVWRPRLHCADHNQFQGMLLALRQLRRRQYRRIGLVVLEGFARRTLHTWEGAYHYVQQQVPRECRLPVLVRDNLDREKFRAWLKRYEPEAVVSSHLCVRDWLEEDGWRVPGKIGFVFLDWLDESNRCAGINQHYELIAAAAVDLVVEQLRRNEHGVPANPKLVLLDGDWVDGPTVR